MSPASPYSSAVHGEKINENKKQDPGFDPLSRQTLRIISAWLETWRRKFGRFGWAMNVRFNLLVYCNLNQLKCGIFNWIEPSG